MWQTAIASYVMTSLVSHTVFEYEIKFRRQISVSLIDLGSPDATLKARTVSTAMRRVSTVCLDAEK